MFIGQNVENRALFERIDKLRLFALEADDLSLIDEFNEAVIELDETTHERPPETIDAVTREVVRGVHKLDGRLLLVLDIERLIASSGASSREQDK